MPTCDFCEADFYPSSAAWAAGVCGDCYAAQLRLRLDGEQATGPRKPLRRASAPTAAAATDLAAGDVAAAGRHDLAA